jgi:hypothetical protein
MANMKTARITRKTRPVIVRRLPDGYGFTLFNFRKVFRSHRNNKPGFCEKPGLLPRSRCGSGVCLWFPPQRGGGGVQGRLVRPVVFPNLVRIRLDGYALWRRVCVGSAGGPWHGCRSPSSHTTGGCGCGSCRGTASHTHHRHILLPCP